MGHLLLSVVFMGYKEHQIAEKFIKKGHMLLIGRFILLVFFPLFNFWDFLLHNKKKTGFHVIRFLKCRILALASTFFLTNQQ